MAPEWLVGILSYTFYGSSHKCWERSFSSVAAKGAAQRGLTTLTPPDLARAMHVGLTIVADYPSHREQDLRSTNGTYIVDAATGDKMRLAPRKVTMLPEEGCRVHFGGVVCKVGTLFGVRILIVGDRCCLCVAFTKYHVRVHSSPKKERR